MAESSKPVDGAPAATETSVTKTDTPAAVESTQEKAVASDKTETVPAVKSSTGAVLGSTTDASPAQTVPMIDKTAEGVKKSTDEVEPVRDGVLGYKDPGTMM